VLPFEGAGSAGDVGAMNDGSLRAETKARLADAGWTEDRRWPTDGLADRLKGRGFSLFPAANAFLERYGGLRVRGGTTHWRGTEIYFHTDPDDVATDSSWILEWEQVTGTRVVPIGTTAYAEYLLIMDEHGRVFGMDLWLNMTYWADDASMLLDIVLAHDGTFRSVHPDDRRPLPRE
jgi:hypothetical protein